MLFDQQSIFDISPQQRNCFEPAAAEQPARATGTATAPRLFKMVPAALGGLAIALAMSVASPAQAREGVTNRVADAARGCVTSGLCNRAGPTGRAFGLATRSADRLGWEIGRTMSIRQNGVDPGRYPGIRRR